MGASVRGHKGVVDVLLRYGADVDQQNGDGHTALMFAYNGRNQVSPVDFMEAFTCPLFLPGAVCHVMKMS